jgi:selenide,water dikinase
LKCINITHIFVSHLSELAKINGVSAMTDVTGFGLIGHLIEMAEGSNLTAELNYKSIPIIASLPYYISKSCIPDATYRNWNAYSNSICFSKNVDVAEAFTILPDPQTNGGILFSAKPSCLKEIQELLIENNLQKPIILVGDTSDKRNFTHVYDVIRAYWLAINKCKPGELYLIGNSKKNSI